MSENLHSRHETGMEELLSPEPSATDPSAEIEALVPGWAHSCLNVASIQASLEFYKGLGLKLIEDHQEQGWAILGLDQPRYFRLAMFQGHISTNLLNFRGADIHALADRLSRAGYALSKPARREEDGSDSFELLDPDGNVIYFNTFPGEEP
jgi:catechol 2,3-dioxygenase-like lactoylglutathione lyase family enzyme